MAFDAGTTSNRCILFNKAGEICSIAQREFRQIYPKSGWVEHNANEIWATQYGVAAEAMQKIGASAKEALSLTVLIASNLYILTESETEFKIPSPILK